MLCSITNRDYCGYPCHSLMSLSTNRKHSCCTVPRRSTLTFPVEIDFALFETGYCTHDSHQDTQFLLRASLVNRSWSPVAQMFPFRHDVIRSQTPFTAFGSRGMNLERHARSLSSTLDPEQPRCLRPLSFARAVSFFPNLTTLDLACYWYSHWKSTLTHQRDSKPFHILGDEEISMLRTGPLITVLANRSDNRTLLNKLSLSTLPPSVHYPLRGSGSALYILPPLSTTTWPSVIATPAHPLHLTLGTPTHTRACYFEHLASF
jgi:hypothetical protein